MNWLRLATALVKPVMALVDAIRDARRESVRKRIAKERELQRESDLAMLDRLRDQAKKR